MSVSPRALQEWAVPLPSPTTDRSLDAHLPQHDHCVALLAMDRLSVADVDCR